MPLFAGIATTERAQQIVEKVLKNPAGQYTKILFASDSASEQTYGCAM